MVRDVVDHVQSEEKFNIALLDNEEEKEPKKKSWQKPQKKQKASQKKKKVNAPKKKKADDNKENEDNKNAAVSQKVNVALADNDEDEGKSDIMSWKFVFCETFQLQKMCYIISG